MTAKTSINGSATNARIAMLEDQMTQVCWLLAEQTYRSIRLATTVAALIAQQMQPQVQENVLQQLLGTS